MVVYAAAHTPTLALGIPLPGPGTYTYTFDVAAIQRRISALRQGDTTWTDWSKNDLLQSAALHPDERDWQLIPQHVRVVAMVQAASGEILQAALVSVDGRRLVLR